MTIPTELAAVLPCPFCGSTNVQRSLVSQDERSGYNQTITYRCAGCGGNVTEHSKHDKNGWIDDVPADFEARALAKWNRRTESALTKASARLPDGYAYVYPANGGGETIRVGSNGREINGTAPIRAIPYYFDHPKQPADPWATIIALCEALDIDPETARSAPGKPSDVILEAARKKFTRPQP